MMQQRQGSTEKRVAAAVAAAWLCAQSAAWGAATGNGSGAAGAASVRGVSVSMWDLFRQSFDLFSVLLVVGSVAAGAVLARCLVEVRSSRILPRESEQTALKLAREGRWGELARFAEGDRSFVGRVVHAAMSRRGDKASRRDAAEMAASEECARWFRKIEPLSVIGNLGPLLGLAGTVWGMIIAFSSLGQTGGQASPAYLSLGISKALFHTLLGLLLAVPSLTAFGLWRVMLDRVCNRAMTVSAEVFDMLPEGGDWASQSPRLAGEAGPGGGVPVPRKPVAPAAGGEAGVAAARGSAGSEAKSGSEEGADVKPAAGTGGGVFRPVRNLGPIGPGTTEVKVTVGSPGKAMGA